jgi:hypothetical protein
LTEGARRTIGGFDGDVFRQGGVAQANHADAEEDQIRGSGVLDGVEGDGGGGQDGGHAEGGGEHVEESSEECADRGLQAFAAASSKGAGENVEDAGAGSDGEKNCGSEEEQETVGVEHGKESIRVGKHKVQSTK